MNKTLITTALAAVFGVATLTSQAAVLQTGDLLTVAPGVGLYDDDGNPAGITSGSWFAADTNADSVISDSERYVTSPGSAGGLIVGVTQEPGEIEQSNFFNNDGALYTVSPPTSGDGTLDLSGLRWEWNNVYWDFSGGAWTPTNAANFGAPTSGYADGVALFSWNGVYGDSYSLWYATTEPEGSATGCGGCRFFWHLEGTVVAAEVPVPAALWLFASGLLGLSIWRRRR